MTFYPKLPTGPSSLGAAQVRALQARGGDFQFSQRDSSTRAFKQGDFTRVIVDGVEYVTGGHTTDETFRGFGVQRYLTPGQPVAGTPVLNTSQRDSFAGPGKYVHEYQNVLSPGTPVVFTYPVGSTTEAINIYRINTEHGVVLRNIYGGAQLIGPATVSMWSAHRGHLTGGFTTHIEYGGPDHYLSAALIDGGRSDIAGRQLQNPIVYHWSKEDSFGVPINPSFARADAEFSDCISITVVQGGAFVLLAELFTRTEMIEEGEDYRPRLWCLWLGKPDMVTGLVFDVTETLFRNSRIPTPVDFEPDQYYKFDSGFVYNRNMNVTMELLTTVALPGNAMLAFYWVDSTDTDPFARLRIARITMGETLTADLLYEEVVERDGASTPIVQHAVHLGQGHVLAKRLSGLSNTNRRVSFMRSTDYGTTWADLTPTGFDNDMLNQYFGDFTVHSPRTDTDDGVVLTTSWDATKEAYFIYSSSDGGDSWRRQGRLFKPDEFRRIDQTVHEVDPGTEFFFPFTEGGNFTQLLPGPNPSRLVDPTIPGRYSI